MLWTAGTDAVGCRPAHDDERRYGEGMPRYDPSGASDPSDGLTVADLDPAQPIGDGQLVLDVREQREWDDGHVPGALHVPMADLPSRIDELPDAAILVVCRSGARSARVVAWLEHTGFEARNLDDGMQAWLAAGLPMEAAGGEAPVVR